MTFHVLLKSHLKFKSEMFWTLLGQTGIVLGGITGIKVLTQAVSPGEFGRFALANTILLLIGANVFGPIGQGFMRFWSIAMERREIKDFSCLSGKIIRLLSFWILWVGFGTALVLFFLKDGRWALLIFLSIATGILTGQAGIRLSILMGARERKRVALINTCAAFAKPLMGVLLVYLFVGDATLILTGYLISMCGIVIVCENQFKKLSNMDNQIEPKLEPTASHRLKNELFSFIWPFYIWGIFGWLHQFCDRWAIQLYHGADVVGAFFVISQLAVYPLVAGSSFLSTFFIPIAYQKAGGFTSGETFRSASRILWLMTAFYLIGAVLLSLIYWFFHAQVVVLISSDQFTAFSSYLPGLTVAWGLYYLGQMFAGFGLLANKPVMYMAPIIISGLLLTLLSFPLSSRYGVPGVVWAIGLAGAVYAVWACVISCSLIRRKAMGSDQ